MTDKIKEAHDHFIAYIQGDDPKNYDVGQNLMEEFMRSIQEALRDLVKGIYEPPVMALALSTIMCTACNVAKVLEKSEQEEFFEILKDNGYDLRFVEVANE